MGISNVIVDIEARIAKYKKDMADARNQMRSLKKDSEDTNAKMRSEFEKSGGVVQKLQSRLLALFSVAAIAGFIRKIIDIRVEFEKYNAVLKTLLGSQIAADNAQKMIRKSADYSTYSVQLLTDAYIRLVNAGIKPSFEQMKKLINVAMSSNKSIEQLTEAIFDAAMGVTRGLRDFKIASEIHGKKIQLTFRDVTKEVDFTTEAIAEFVIGLGDLPGVVGTAEEVAGRLTGTVDDLGDSFEKLIDNLGKLSEDETIGGISTLTNLVNLLNASLTELEKQDVTGLGKFRSNMKAIFGEHYKELFTFYKYLNPIVGLLPLYTGGMNELATVIDKHNKEMEDAIALGDKDYKQIVEQIKTIPILKEELKALEDEKDKINIKDTKAIRANDILIRQKKEEIAKYSDYIGWLEKEAKFRKDLANELEKEAKARREIWIAKLIETMDLESDEAKYFWETAMKAAEDYANKLKSENEKIKTDQAETTDTLKGYMTEYMNSVIEGLEKLAEAEAKKQEAKRQAIETTFAIVSQYTDLLLAKNQAAMDKELAAAGDNEKKKEEIRRKYGKKEQNLAVIRAIISGAEAIAKNFADLGFILGTPVNVLQAIATGIQIATIKAQKFARGTLNIQGRGTGTSDSIPSWISKGESVMTAKETSEYLPYLKAMKEGNFFRFQEEMVDKLAAFKAVTNNNLNYDNSKEIRELRRIQNILERNPKQEYISGNKKIIKKGNVTIRIDLN